MSVRRILPGVFLIVVLTASHVRAQATAPAIPAQPQLFPSDSKIAFVDLNQVASNSVPGKELFARLKAFRDGKLFELTEKQKQLDGLQAQFASPAIPTDSARSQIAMNIEKMKREIQFGSDSAQAELNDLEQSGLAELRRQIAPILKDIATERHLDLIFSSTETSAPFVDPRIDVSAEVTKRLDATLAKK